MSIFKNDNNTVQLQRKLGISGADAAKEAFDYVIDAVQETNISSAFVLNTREPAQLAQESSTEPTAPRKILYGEAVIGGNIVWRVSPEDGETQLAIVWAQGEVEEVTEIFLDGQGVNVTQQYPLGYFAGNYVGESMLGVSSNSISDSFLLSVKPSYWDGLHFFGGCCWSYLFLRFNAAAFPNGFPDITAKIKGRKIYDPRKDSTAGSILHNSSLGTTHRANNSATWEYNDNAALCLLNYMTDYVMGLGEPISKFDEQSLRDAIDLCEESVLDSNNQPRKRYTCNGAIFANKSHRENIKQLLTSMNGKLVYSNGKYHILPYAYRTAHSDIIDESIIVGEINYSAKQGRVDTYNRVKGTFNSLHDNYVVTDYPVQYSGADADGLTYDDKDGETIYLEYNLPLTTNVEDAQRLARLMLLRSRMQSSVTFTTNMSGLKYKAGDTIQFSNELLGFTGGLEKEFEITDYIIQNDIETGITVQITAKEVVLAIYNWQASDAIDYTADELVEVWDGFLPAVTNLEAQVVDYASGNIFNQFLRVDFDYNVTNQLKEFVIVLSDAVSGQTIKTISTRDTSNLFPEIEINTYTVFTVSVYPVSVKNVEGATVAEADLLFFRERNTPINQYLFPSNNTNKPTDSQFQAYFGFLPQDGDKVIVYTTDATGAVTDSIQYVYASQLRMQHIRAIYIGDKYGARPDIEEATGITLPQLPYDVKKFSLDSDTFSGVTVTWSINTFNFEFYANDERNYTVSQPTDLTFTTSADGLSIEVTASQGDVFPASFEFVQEKYQYTVTATYAGGSLTSTPQYIDLKTIREQP